MNVKSWIVRQSLKLAVARLHETLEGTKMLEWLRGKKTYIVGVGTIAYGVWVYVIESDVERGVNLVIAGVSMMTVRAGITKSGPTQQKPPDAGGGKK